MSTKLNKPRGTRIKRLREESGLSVKELAERVDHSEQAVYQWESGANIKPENVSKLARIFRVPESYIYDGNSVSGVRFLGKNVPGFFPKIPLDRMRGVPFDSVMAELHEAEEFVAAHFPTGDTSLAFELVDGSNSPTFGSGDVIIVDPARPTRPGCYVLAQIDDDEYVFRRYRQHDSGFSLVPDNPDWPTLNSEKSNIRLCGVMTQYVKPAQT